MGQIFADGLSKTYPGGVRAVDRVSFSLDAGDIFGFLGPNGAGKTTTIKLFCGMLSPTEGKCCIFGIDPACEPEKLHQIAGIVTEHAQMYDHLTGAQNLSFYGTLFGMDRKACEARADYLLSRLALKDAADRKLSEYSTGMRQRLSLARAMMHGPKILFLDEPTSGLDPESAQNVNAFLRELANDGTTVFLCTHQLRYAEEICTKYGLMNRGHLMAQGTLASLRAEVDGRTRVRIRANRMPKEVDCRTIGTGLYELYVDGKEEIPVLVRRIAAEGIDLYHVSEEPLSLEEIYFSLIDRSMEKETQNI